MWYVEFWRGYVEFRMGYVEIWRAGGSNPGYVDFWSGHVEFWIAWGYVEYWTDNLTSWSACAWRSHLQPDSRLWLLLTRPTPQEPANTFPSPVQSSLSWTSRHVGRQRWRAATARASSATSYPLLCKWCTLRHNASRRTSRTSRNLWSIFDEFHCWRQWLSSASSTAQLWCLQYHVFHKVLRQWVVWQTVADAQFVFAGGTVLTAKRAPHVRFGK